MSLPSQQVIAVSAKASHWGGEQHPYYLIAAAVRHCLTVSGFRMLFVARRIEHPLDVKVQRPQHTDPRGLFLSSFEGATSGIGTQRQLLRIRYSSRSNASGVTETTASPRCSSGRTCPNG